MSDRVYRILVVDDDASVLFTYKLLLQRQGYDVTAVVSSTEAKESLNNNSYDLLLCDLSLEQGRSGFEVLEYARDVNAALPSVLLTGYASAESAQKAESLGVRVLYKPIEIQEFLTTIPQVLKETYEQAKTGTC